MSQDVRKRVVEIVGKQLEIEPDKIELEASFTDDLKADSLAVVELVLALEEEFGCEISDEETEKIRTVKDAVSFIEAQAA